MRVWVEKIVTYDHLPVGKMHFHVRFAEEEPRFHRSCEVIVFVDIRDKRNLHELKVHAINEARAFLREIVMEEGAASGRIPTAEPFAPPSRH